MAWSLAPGSAKNTGPKNLSTGKVVSTVSWDYSLGQAYTEGNPSRYYDIATSCGTFSTNFWQSIAQDFGCGAGWQPLVCKTGSPGIAGSQRGVPMVCGSGNCQEAAGKYPCFDERMSGAQISEIINTRPADYPWKNFAIWYGTGQQLSCPDSDVCIKNADAQSCGAIGNCVWSPYKKNPSTSNKGLCSGNTDVAWGCEKKW